MKQWGVKKSLILLWCTMWNTHSPAQLNSTLFTFAAEIHENWRVSEIIFLFLRMWQFESELLKQKLSPCCAVVAVPMLLCDQLIVCNIFTSPFGITRANMKSQRRWQPGMIHILCLKQGKKSWVKPVQCSGKTSKDNWIRVRHKNFRVRLSEKIN